MVGNVGHLWDMYGTCLDNLWEKPLLTWETSMVDDLCYMMVNNDEHLGNYVVTYDKY